MNRTLLLIFGIAIITFFLRYLPFRLMSQLKFSKRTSLFLRCVPFSAISALVIPDVLSAIPNNPSASYIGAISALIFSYIFKNYLYTVIGSISVVYFVISFL